jgi:hypothetical protein
MLIRFCVSVTHSFYRYYQCREVLRPAAPASGGRDEVPLVPNPRKRLPPVQPPFFLLARLRLVDYRANVLRPAFGILRWPKRPAQGGLPAPSVEGDTIVVAMDFVEPGRAGCDFDERFSVHMQKKAFACDDDGSALLVPTGVGLTRRAGAAESEIIGAMCDVFFFKARLQLW